jgi:hypothetical protein
MHPAAIPAVDGGMFDALTILTGLLVVCIKVPFRGLSTYTVLDFLNGAVIFPFLALLLLPIAHWLSPTLSYPGLTSFVTMLKTTNTISIALAGGVGLVFVLVELAKPNHTPAAPGASSGG